MSCCCYVRLYWQVQVERRTSLTSPATDCFREMYRLNASPVGQGQFWAVSVLLDICGLLNFLWLSHFFCSASTMGELDPPSVLGTSKMCFGLHSVTMNSMQIVFMFCFFFLICYFTCFWKGENKGSELVLCWPDWEKKRRRRRRRRSTDVSFDSLFSSVGM